MTAQASPKQRHHRTLFVSDIHLGFKSSKAEELVHFLRFNTADTIYLVGDIIDLWKVRRGTSWPQSHNDVLQKLMRQARKGTRIVFIPGNHDEAVRQFTGAHFGAIEISRDAIHETADGKLYAVMHGDEFDIVMRYAKWLAFLGDRSYDLAIWTNGPLNWVRRRLGFGYWSLSAYLKTRVKGVVSFIGEYEENLAEVARRKSVDGVICGHIHCAADRQIEDIHYLNCGDWVESCTAVCEDYAGNISLIDWSAVLDMNAPKKASDPIFEAAE